MKDIPSLSDKTRYCNILGYVNETKDVAEAVRKLKEEDDETSLIDGDLFISVKKIDKIFGEFK